MIVVKDLSYSAEDPSHLLRILDPSNKNSFFKNKCQNVGLLFLQNFMQKLDFA